MLKNMILKIGTIQSKSEQQKITTTFRYFSWFITSVFYLLEDPPSHWAFKLAVIILLFISVRITVEAYYRYDKHTRIVKILVFVETLGIILILLPTGGLYSPFIWYALNPILISVGFSSRYFSWLNLMSYLGISTIISFLFFNEYGEGLFRLISRHSHLILIFILITLAVQLMTNLNKTLKRQSNELFEANVQLNRANQRIEESMEHVMSLYQIVETFTSQDNNRNLYQTFVDYTAKLTSSDIVFFRIRSSENDSDMYYTTGTIPQWIKDKLNHDLEEINGDKLFITKLINMHVHDDYNFKIIHVNSISRHYGIIGIRTNNSKSEDTQINYDKKLEFISGLCAVILERFHLEEITEKLMIVEEQDRIANEMHDSVAQRLFGISYTIHSVLGNWGKMSSPKVQEKLKLLRDSAHLALKELRSTIYKLSSRKGGSNRFLDDTREYLNNISELHNVAIDFDVFGDEQFIGVSEKRALYRIICEATGNAIRHGKGSRITIHLHITHSRIELVIQDNGKGFTVNDKESSNVSGLGLQNMEWLVKLFDGDLDIQSELGISTTIRISIPNKNRAEKGA